MAFVVATKKDKNSTAVKTNVTVVHDHPGNERALATQALVVKWQGTMRKDGVVIPSDVTLKMSEWGPGTRHDSVVNPIEVAKTMTPEQRAALIAELQKMQQK